LDIEGAFKSTSYEYVCAELVRHGVDHTIIRWIRATLEGRLATVTLGGVSRSAAVSRGCPQGGVLSPLLWCPVVNDLLTRLSKGVSTSRDMQMTFVFWLWGNFPTRYQGSRSGLFILFRCGVTSSVCRLILTRPGSSPSREGSSRGSSNPVFLEWPCNAPCRLSIWG
jgi:hypothetical protein